MNDALYIAVTGFQTQVAGNKLIEALGEIGFKVEFCADGESDPMGGIIETTITPTTTLETDEPGEIIAALLNILPDVLFSVLHKSYVVDHEDEIHIDPSEVSECEPIAPDLRVVGKWQRLPDVNWESRQPITRSFGSKQASASRSRTRNVLPARQAVSKSWHSLSLVFTRRSAKTCQRN